MYLSVRDIDLFCLLGYGTVPIVWYFLFFILLACQIFLNCSDSVFPIILACSIFSVDYFIFVYIFG